MDERAATWFDRRTSRSADWTPTTLLEAKRGTTVSVVIPARNETKTIAGIVSGIRDDLMHTHALVDELVVIDSDSTDDTARRAGDAGATVHASRDIRPDLGSHAGKGEALWKSQFVTTGDVLVFVDADLTEWGTHFVTGLLGPLLTDPDVLLVKGFYDRLFDDAGPQHAPQGGRVTELMARPLIDLYWPQAAAVVQPLAGEWAIRRDTFGALDVPIGYGVELSVLLDVLDRHGLDALAQVDLGERAHAHQSVHDLAVMAAELLALANERLGVSTQADELWQYGRDTSPPWRSRAVPRVRRAARRTHAATR